MMQELNYKPFDRLTYVTGIPVLTRYNLHYKESILGEKIMRILYQPY